MKTRNRRAVQIAVAVFIAANSILYYLYIEGILDIKIFSIADLNPYGGWSHLKNSITDVSYRWRGITRGIALTIAITLSAIVTGRIFCGFVCPIGFVQDIAQSLGKKLKIREHKAVKLFSNFEKVKYLVFLLVIILGSLGFGYVISHFSPWLGFLNFFAGFRFHSGFLVLIAVVITGMFVRRPFCRFLCPLGAYQALLTSFGFLKVRDSGECESCRYCIVECPVGINEFNDGTASPECISCMKCVGIDCIRDTKGYSLDFFKMKINPNKAVAFGLSLIFGIYLLLPVIGQYNNRGEILPVGSLNNGNFTGVGIGFGGPITVQIEVDDNELKMITVLNHRETSGYYEEVFRHSGREIVETKSLYVDAISGATSTTRGFLSAVKSSISQAKAIDFRSE